MSILNESFESYDEAGAISKGINNAKLAELIKNKNDPQIAKKMASVNKICKAVQLSIGEEAKKLGVNISEIKLADYTTCSAEFSDPKITTKFALQNDKNGGVVAHVALNLNVHTTMTLPPQELYASIYAVVYNALLVKTLTRNNKPLLFNEDFNYNNTFEKGMGELKTDVDFVISYLKYFLSKYLGSEYKSFDVARKIVDDIGPDEAFKMFSMDSRIAVPSDKDLLIARNRELIRKYTTTLNSDNSQLAVGFMQQSIQLISVDLESSFKKIVSMNNTSGIRDFASDYVIDFLQSNDLPADYVQLTFKEDSSKGAFYDGAVPKIINVDLSKIENITDLVMTLAHESTHALDSYSKEFGGARNRNDNDIEWDSISESGLDKHSEAYNLLRKVDCYCYHLDSDERRARLAELSALKFMQRMAESDYSLKEEIRANTEKFERYQQKTIDIANRLYNNSESNELKEILRRYNNIKDMLPSKARKMFEQRIDFLESLSKSSLDMSKEEQSISLESAKQMERSF